MICENSLLRVKFRLLPFHFIWSEMRDRASGEFTRTETSERRGRIVTLNGANKRRSGPRAKSQERPLHTRTHTQAEYSTFCAVPAFAFRSHNKASRAAPRTETTARGTMRQRTTIHYSLLIVLLVTHSARNANRRRRFLIFCVYFFYCVELTII